MATSRFDRLSQFIGGLPVPLNHVVGIALLLLELPFIIVFMVVGSFFAGAFGGGGCGGAVYPSRPRVRTETRYVYLPPSRLG